MVKNTWVSLDQLLSLVLAGEILKHWDNVKVDGHADEVLEFVSGL